MSARLDHLTDGRTVVVPFMLAGHHARDTDAASPVAGRVIVGDDNAPPHPYAGGGMLLVELCGGSTDGQRIAVATERLAHLDPCPECAPLWERLRRELVGVPDDGMISGGLMIDVPGHGPSTLIVDVWDLPESAFDPGAG